MEVTSENTCINVFIHNAADEIAEAFTELWAQLINEKEEDKNVILQTNI